MYDIIGDIHGHAEPLKRLLEKLGYAESNGSWQHPQRKAIFVGDYIDRGPDIRETLQIVRGMNQSGHAIALLGNHEYNAMAYHYKVDDIPLRKNNKKNTRQHEATLAQFRDHPEEWQMYLDWFYTLPLFFEGKGIRVVHACWDEDHIQWLKDNFRPIARNPKQEPENKPVTMNIDLLIASRDKQSIACEVINGTLKGKEFDIPEQYAWLDKDGHVRKSNRTKWWVEPNANVYENWLFDCHLEMKALKIDSSSNPYVYPADAPPVFFGHYWMEDKYPVIQDKNVICLDYSIAREGSLVAYRWSGEQELDAKNFVSVEYKE